MVYIVLRSPKPHANYSIFGISKLGTPNISYFLWRFLDDKAIPLAICTSTWLFAAKWRTSIQFLFTKSCSYLQVQSVCNHNNHWPRVRTRKSSVIPRGVQVSKNRQFPLSLHTHFLGLSPVIIVISSSSWILPTKRTSDRVFKKISLDPSITFKYFPW